MVDYKKNEKRKLLIVGNGFDRAHSLPTGYEHFKKYLSDLIKEYEGIPKSDEYIKLKEIPKSTIPKIHTRNGLIADYEQERKIIYWLIDDVAKKKHDIKWHEFENYLGQLQFNKVLRKWGKSEFDMYCLRDSIRDISGFFFEWVNTIELSGTQKKEPYTSLINKKKDIAISFNYTETLEYVYGMDESNICHIHGQRETDRLLQKEKNMLSFGKNNSSLVVGFGSKHVKNSKEARNKGILMTLYKNTESIIYEYNDFFERIANEEIQEIYTWGFSFSDTDTPYIEKISEELRKNDSDKEMTWYIAPYGNFLQRVKDEIHFRKCIRHAGFRGKICILKLDT